MKKTILVFLLIFLFVFLSSCESGKKMKGFTYEELAEYFSSVDGLTELGSFETVVEPGEYVLQEDGTYVYEGGGVFEVGNPLYISCGDDSLKASVKDMCFNDRNHNPYIGISLSNLLEIEILFPGAWRSDKSYPKIPQCDPAYYELTYIYSKNGTRSENNVAYVIRNLGFNSSPDWKDWLDYEIPWNSYNVKGSHGLFNMHWYNPLSEDFERGVYYSQSDDFTEIYVVYQEISLFSAPLMSFDDDIRYFAPLLISETKYNELKAEYPSFKYDHYKKGTVQEFSEWFMGEYIEEIPAVFADIEDEYIYYPAYGNGVHPEDLNGEEYDCDAMFIPDMKNLGVNFDELRSYIIKITVPHDGVFSDIYWELIG